MSKIKFHQSPFSGSRLVS